MLVAWRSAAGFAVVAMVVQACAGSATHGPQSTSSGQGAQGVPSYGVHGADNYLKVEWEPGNRGGRPLVSGYVTNQSGWPISDVRLRVEALDAAGAVTATYIGYANGIVTPGSRIYFEIPVQANAQSHRVTVLSFDPIQGRG